MILEKLAIDQRMQTQNLVHMLQNRESGYTRHNKLSQSAPLSYERQFYKAITPCLTIGISIPPVYLRKFTPDGSKLLAFSHDQRSCIVYTYKGVGSERFGQLLNEANVGSGETYNVNINNQLRSTAFDKLFETKYVLRLCNGDTARYYLHREFSIFHEDGRYVLLAGMCILNGCNIPISDYERYPDLFDKLDMFSYIFFVVDLQHGIVTDEVQLPQDSICLSHNHGISMHSHTIAILSRLRQAIYIYELVDGRLIKHEHEIGPRPRECAFQAVEHPSMLDVNTLLPISHIKQRVLSFLYRQIQQDDPQTGQKYIEFYKNFDFIENMIIEKMQLVDSDLILLRYEERPKDSDVAPMLTTGEPQPPRRLYVFYCMTSEDVSGVYQDDSLELLQIVVQFYNKMCNVRSLQTGDVPSLPTHYFMRQNYVNPNKTIPFMRQAALRFNPSVPVSTQSFSTSPYLNYNVFNYDDRLVSPLERPKPCSTEPIIFRDRVSNLIKYRLNTKARRPHNALAPRELCAFICHPFEPLIISIQKCMHVYDYKLHIYNHGTTVEQFYN
ncbi:DET1 homolog isoform X1 [Drosophila sulfurigaster albostrigata]|uniref:DET1 homolog isoform X1 n=2 Tax=Drosophila sulfurigaster albostrigata TaxID=89887 RepID=UPI002D21A025|nr:DET1 homolog isoform X1 [Drosophila sulfurigaster albostrigata]